METVQFKKDKKTLFTIMGLAWLAFVALVVLGAIPLTNKLYQSKDDLELAKLTLNEIKADLSKRDTYRNLRESIDQSKYLIEAALLKDQTIVNFIEDLEQTAKETGNQISIATYVPPKTKKTTTESEPSAKNTNQNAANTSSANSAAEKAGASQNSENSNENKGQQYFMLTITGGYQQLLRYLAKLENMNYIFKIESIDSKTKTGVNNVSMLDLQQKDSSEKAGPIETKIIISYSLQK